MKFNFMKNNSTDNSEPSAITFAIILGFPVLTVLNIIINRNINRLILIGYDGYAYSINKAK